MLDIKFIRENLDLVKAGAAKKHIAVDLDRLIAVDEDRRKLLGEVEQLNQQKKVAADARDIEQGKSIKESLQQKEKKLEEVTHEWQLLMVQVPNIPDMSVPEGDSDADNKEVRVWPARGDGRGGDKPKFDFEPKSHVELMEALDMADFERGTKVAGFRGYFLKGAGAVLAFAVLRYAQEMLTQKGFTPMIVPSMVKRVNFLGTGYVPQSEEDLYKTQDGDYLAGTGEVATMGYYMNEVLDMQKLPIKLGAFSPCFRREIGAHGKDTKGIVRVHEFYKWEQVVLCEASHEQSVKLHEELTANAEGLLQGLNIPYHVVVNCGGDIGLGQVKKYDIEAWVPSEQKYRETHSASYFHDFQTRRLNIKYRDSEGKLQYAHSLNNTAIAIPRFLVPLIENNQQADGSVMVPAALQAYVGTDRITKT
jgi:seryl-tRNA synthetase